MRSYFGHIVDLVGDGLGNVNYVGDSPWLVLYWCFFVMGVGEVGVVGEQAEASPEEEAVDPPTHRVPILLCISKLVPRSGSSSSSLPSSSRSSLSRSFDFSSCSGSFFFSVANRLPILWVVTNLANVLLSMI